MCVVDNSLISWVLFSFYVQLLTSGTVKVSLERFKRIEKEIQSPLGYY